MKKQVVIIGAGPAGLTAAYELLKRDQEYKMQVTVLEASGEIGGISRTVRYRGNRMDIGGHRFFSKDERIMNWWKEQMPIQGMPSYDDKVLGRTKSLQEGGPDPENEDKVMLVRRRVSRIYYKNKFFDYPVTLKPKTLAQMGAVQTVRAGCSYLLSCVHKRPENSLENFYINRFGKVLYSMFFEGYTEKLWGRHPSEISADWGAQRVKGLSIRKVLEDAFYKACGKQKADTETSLIEEFIYPKYGPGQLWEQVAEEVEDMGGLIIRNAEVTGYYRNKEGADMVEYASPGGERRLLRADYCLSSMPLKDLVHCMPDAPKEICRVAEGLPYRDFVTVGLLLNSIDLKNETDIPTIGNIVPDCWIYVQDTQVKVGRIQIFNNWSPYLVKDIDHTVWIGLEYFCREGDAFWSAEEKDTIRLAVGELMKMGILKDEKDVLDAHVERVPKAYPAYFDTYDEISKLTGWLDECESLFCIGRNGQHRYNNMDHSMMTAMEAVDNILCGRKDKKNVWNVNTEKEYHESK